MSLNQREIGQLVSVVRALIVDVDNQVGVDTNLAFADLDEVVATGLTRDQIAVLVNRAYKELPSLGTPPALAES